MSTTSVEAAAAPEAAQNPRRTAQTAAYYAAFVAMGLVLCVLGPTLPGLARHTGMPLATASLLFMARSGGYLIGSCFIGRVYDRRAGNPIMGAAMLIITAACVLTPLISSLPLLMALILVQGIAGIAMNVGTNTLLVWAHHGRPGGHLNGLHFSFGVGALLSPLVVERTIAFSGDVRWAYWVLTLAFVPLAVWLFKLQSPPPHHDASHHASGRLPYLLVALVAAFFVLYTGTEASVGSWLFNYVLATRLADAQGAAYLNSAFWALLTAGRLLAIPLLRRFRPRTILYCDLAGCLVSVAVILLWPASLAARRVALTGKITGWFFAGSSVGSMFMPWLVGIYFESVGPHVLPTVAMIDLSLAVVLLTVLLFHYSRPVHVTAAE
jgi:FHS family Na+ dependent glucose MFS transporter 1